MKSVIIFPDRHRVFIWSPSLSCIHTDRIESQMHKQAVTGGGRTRGWAMARRKLSFPKGDGQLDHHAVGHQFHLVVRRGRYRPWWQAEKWIGSISVASDRPKLERQIRSTGQGRGYGLLSIPGKAGRISKLPPERR